MPINSFENYRMSWKPDKSVLRRPFYLSIAQLLEHDITNGFLAPGTKLPPQRELADFLDINFTTITRSYKICELKGLIYAVTGSGTFVSPNATRSITISTDKVSRDCIDLGFVASFEQCNYMILENTQKVIEKPYLEQLFNYNDPTGIPHQNLLWMERLSLISSCRAKQMKSLLKKRGLLSLQIIFSQNIFRKLRILVILLVFIDGYQYWVI